MDDRPADPVTGGTPSEPGPPGETPAGPAGEPPAVQGAPPPIVGWAAPQPEQRPRRRVLRTVVGVLVGVVAVIVVLAVIGANVDPRDAKAREAGERLLAMPEFKERYGEVDTADEAFALGQQLSQTAMAHLDDRDLLRAWELNIVLLEKADDAVCARVIRQQLTRGDAEAMSQLLDEDQYGELIDLTFKAFEAELSGAPAPEPPTDEQVNASYVALAGQMGQEDLLETANTMIDPNASPAEACGAARLWLDGTMKLGEPERGDLLRFMSTP